MEKLTLPQDYAEKVYAGVLGKIKSGRKIHTGANGRKLLLRLSVT